MQNLPDTEHSYMGRKWDEETQTYYFRHRNYSPQYGRFTTRDPILYKKQLRNSFNSNNKIGFSKYFDVSVYFPITEDGIALPYWNASLYTGQYFDFVRNNPLNYLDPMGLYRVTPEEKLNCRKDPFYYYFLRKDYEDLYGCYNEKYADAEHYCLGYWGIMDAHYPINGYTRWWIGLLANHFYEIGKDLLKLALHNALYDFMPTTSWGTYDQYMNFIGGMNDGIDSYEFRESHPEYYRENPWYYKPEPDHYLDYEKYWSKYR